MTNLSLINNNDQTMSSLEIAELTGKEHSNVMRDIREMFYQLGKDIESDQLKIEFSERINNLGFTVNDKSYLLTKEESLCLVAGYSAALRMAIIKRWQELEAQQGPQIPQTYAAALLEAGRLALEVEQKTLQLTHANNVIAINAPKAEFFDNYAYCGGSLGFREVAKLLKAKENEFSAFLCGKHIMYRLGKTLTAYAQHIDAGRFEVKTGTSERNQYAFAKTVFTPKGVQWIAGEWGKYQAAKALGNDDEKGRQIVPTLGSNLNPSAA